MKANRELCVGMMILGAMSHYDNEEILKYPSLQYVTKTLRKKHFNIKNSTAEDRVWANESYAKGQQYKVRSNAKSVEAISRKHINAVNRMIDASNNWVTHSKISDKAWIKAADSFPATNAITVSGLILALLRKEPAVLKYYGFNDKKLKKYQQSSEFKNEYIFSSSRVATKLLEHLDSEIAYYYANLSDNGTK